MTLLIEHWNWDSFFIGCFVGYILGRAVGLIRTLIKKGEL